MTADDFFLLFIAFGGLLIVTSIFWTFALLADRAQSNKPGPDVRHGPDSPDTPDDHGQKEAARSGRANDYLRRFADQTT